MSNSNISYTENVNTNNINKLSTDELIKLRKDYMTIGRKSLTKNFCLTILIALLSFLGAIVTGVVIADANLPDFIKFTLVYGCLAVGVFVLVCVNKKTFKRIKEKQVEFMAISKDDPVIKKMIEKENRILVIRIVITIVIIVAFAISSGGNSTKTAECGSCGRIFSAGTADYKSIARTNMCDNCTNNYKDMSNWVDEMKANGYE